MSFVVKGFTLGHSFCSNCKKGIHSTPGKFRCKNSDCECKCQTHYIGKDGKLRPYGIEDDSTFNDVEVKAETESNDVIAKINEQYRKRENKVETKTKTSKT